MHFLNAMNHLDSDLQTSLKIKLASALLKQVFQTLAQQIHDHDVEHLALLGLLVTHEMQEWHKGLASQLVDQLALPEQHDVLLALYSFFLYTSKQQKMTHSPYETIYLHFTYHFGGQDFASLLLLHYFDRFGFTT